MADTQHDQLTQLLSESAADLRDLLSVGQRSPGTAKKIRQLIDSLPGKPEDEQQRIIARALKLASAGQADRTRSD
jgi:hypothetical protein